MDAAIAVVLVFEEGEVSGLVEEDDDRSSVVEVVVVVVFFLPSPFVFLVLLDCIAQFREVVWEVLVFVAYS